MQSDETPSLNAAYARLARKARDVGLREVASEFEKMRTRRAPRAGWVEALFSALWRLDEEVLKLFSPEVQAAVLCPFLMSAYVRRGLRLRPTPLVPYRRVPLGCYPVLAVRECLVRLIDSVHFFIPSMIHSVIRLHPELLHTFGLEITPVLPREKRYAIPHIGLTYVLCHSQIHIHGFPVWMPVLIVDSRANQHRVRHYR